MADKLANYRAKRDFASTDEPAGGPPGSEARRPRFVVQEHHARRLHWDLRLERDGVLVSWAIPNGIPEEPNENRKAVHTEDHPLEYIDFEGDIPAGNYGAGSMRIWDRGTYECEKWEPRKVIVAFHGERLRGRYALFRAGDEKDWMVHRMDPPLDPGRQPMPEHVLPMLAKLGPLPADPSGWAYEIKWDGVRAIAYSEPGRLRLESRNLKEITARYPELRALNRALSSHSAILDGEIVAFDEAGRPSFQRLQQRMHLTSDSAVRRRAKELPVVYMLFDVLYLDGHSLMELPYTERRSRLEELDLNGPAWTTPAFHRGDGAALLDASRRQGLEGIVAKRLDSAYDPGSRGGAWLKVKNSRRQELVIGGWLPGEGRRRKRIGALLTGYYEPPGDGSEPALRFAGKVGTGFDEPELDRLGELLAQHQRQASPFSGRQPQKGAVFVEPRFVAEVEFTEWSADGMLRHPSYKGLRDDKDPLEVVLERPAGGQAGVAAVGEAAERRDEPTAEGIDAILAGAVRRADGGAEVTVEGRRLKLTHLDRVLYPAAGFTKAHVLDYYARISAVLVPHLRDRPVTLRRFPNGVERPSFYEKCCPEHRPEWVEVAPVWSERRKERLPFCLLGDLPALLWAANLANIELHPSLSRRDDLGRPTALVFDLDPGPPAGLIECMEVGLLLRGMFDQLGLESLAKTSGGKGLQVYVPLNGDSTYEDTKPFAKAVADTLERAYPELVVARMTRSLREGKVLVDWSQNSPHKSTVCVYSLRARERPTVSTPVTWEELETARERGESLSFDSDQALARVEERGDLFAPALSSVQELPRFG